MLDATALLGFCLVVIPITVTPGASFTLVSSRGLVGDHRGAWATIIGTGMGIFTHAALAGLGLAVVVMRSAQLYGAIRLIGAAYLVGLGLVLLWRARRRHEDPTEASTPPRTTFSRHLWRAYVANVLNVKAATVYLSLGPQFIAAERVGVSTMTQLAAVHVVVMVLWLGAWAWGFRALTSRFDAVRWKRRIDAVGGAVLIALGIRTMAENH